MPEKANPEVQKPAHYTSAPLFHYHYAIALPKGRKVRYQITQPTFYDRLETPTCTETFHIPTNLTSYDRLLLPTFRLKPLFLFVLSLTLLGSADHSPSPPPPPIL